MPFQDRQPPPAKHYRRDYIPGSSVPGIGYPSGREYVYGFPPPQIPDAYPDYGPVATPPPEILERLKSTDPYFHPETPEHLSPRQIDPGFFMEPPEHLRPGRIDPGFHMLPQGGQSLGPGAAVPRRNSTTIMVLPGKNSKQLKDMVEMMGDGFGALSPIFKALMGKDKD